MTARYRPRLRALGPSVAALLLAACEGEDRGNGVEATNASGNMVVEAIEDPDSVNAAADRGAAMPPTDAWLGRWTGPEGLFLDIRPAPDGKAGHYLITNKDSLDRQADYQGVADGTTIRFVRDGADLTIRPGSGDATGFKYLAGKQECLIVIPGREGYCRR
ncbi:MAG: hypothetical protein QHC40_11930 [Sphingobium sp.]|nr:hypothetical protein [Sphingobium sp.]